MSEIILLYYTKLEENIIKYFIILNRHSHDQYFIKISLTTTTKSNIFGSHQI